MIQNKSFRKNLKLVLANDDKLGMGNCDMILTEEQKKYQHYHQIKSMIEQVKFT